MIAYLVVREGNKWRDVYRLVPGQVTTVGRSQDNRIVLHNEICSRHHCEIFQHGDGWRIRDLGSRNGTLLNNVPVQGDRELRVGQLIQIGPSQMVFTDELSEAFPGFDEQPPVEDDTGTAEHDVLEASPLFEPKIIHRKQENRYVTASPAASQARDRMAHHLAQLYRLALEMGSVSSPQRLAEVVLEGLFEVTTADIGALLLLAHPVRTGDEPGELVVVAFRSTEGEEYQKVSDYLSSVVLKGREAVLARDVADDSRLMGRDSLGEIHAKSVICAPLRLGELTFGLIHLYSTNPEQKLESEDLEFTLAVADQCAGALEILLKQEHLQHRLIDVSHERDQLRQQLGIDCELVGDSDVLQRLRDKIARIAPTDAIVLIRGESGVGKELVARAIHFSSRRKQNPFVCMNCAALTESLLESELFGHEKGSFTGATGRKIGKFEQAHRGTLMLDEVGEMSQAIQAKFLRVLEGHPFERVGGGTPIQVDVRVVAATNRDLEKAVEAGTFRKDLYFRLHVVELQVAPLRDRPTDIAVLARYFLERFARKSTRSVKGFTPLALEKLLQYDWPGNVRELQNTVERAVILCGGEMVGANDIQLSNLGFPDDEEVRIEAPPPPAFAAVTLEEIEQQHILAVLDRTNWNKSQAAQILGIERSTLDRKLKRYRVTRPDS